MTPSEPADESATRVARSTARKGWLLFAMQGGLLTFLVLSPRGRSWEVGRSLQVAGQVLRWGGLAFVALGALRLGTGVSPHPAPTPRAILRTSGPYRLVRHPMYTGVLAAGAGVAATSGSAADVAAFVALAGVLSVKARFEERLLSDRFPGYQAYAAVTPRFVPFVPWR